MKYKITGHKFDVKEIEVEAESFAAAANQFRDAHREWNNNVLVECLETHEEKEVSAICDCCDQPSFVGENVSGEDCDLCKECYALFAEDEARKIYPDSEVGELVTLIFFRDDMFYPIEIKNDRKVLQQNVERNPGTIRVERIDKVVVWPEQSKAEA